MKISGEVIEVMYLCRFIFERQLSVFIAYFIKESMTVGMICHDYGFEISSPAAGLATQNFMHVCGL